MRIMKIIKKNKLLAIVAFIYGLLFLFMPEKAATAMGNSVYYLIEMIEIFPVIFLLTVVIEALVPKEMIINHFGDDSGLLGNFLSLILGSISAGPIYAAFPISKMLLKKGASVPNIVIILSSWAVIKVPMLANEAKFLGVSFMGIRWILTVITILIMAWITGKMIKKEELLSATEVTSNKGVEINEDYCIGCGVCTKMLPEVYEMIDKKAKVRINSVNPSHKIMIRKTIDKCPTKAIAMEMNEGEL